MTASGKIVNGMAEEKEKRDEKEWKPDYEKEEESLTTLEGSVLLPFSSLLTFFA